MRPRHKAAENRPCMRDSRGPDPAASMRPRHKAAENHAIEGSTDVYEQLLQ